MLKKNLSIFIIFLLFLLLILFFASTGKEYTITEVFSPTKFELNAESFEIKDLDSFDSVFSSKNLELSKVLGISETEAFVLGNLAKQWAKNLMQGRDVLVRKNSDLFYYRQSYRTKFLHSGFCLLDSKPYDKVAYEKRLLQVKKGNYKVFDLDSDRIYSPNDVEVCNLKNYIVVRKSHLPKKDKNVKVLYEYNNGSLQIFVSDLTTKYIPDRNCSTTICTEILKNINKAEKSIDIAIYGYSRVPVIETALKKAMDRGVKIRLVYDIDSTGQNIYPDTKNLLEFIKNYNNDKNSDEAKYIMHNKFYIFDDKILITGSANLSNTDMSGFNTNSVIVINSEEVSKAFKMEFEQMYNGKFHSEKVSYGDKRFSISGKELEIYFSPQDKAITNCVLPLIRRAKHYIYIPTFVLTEKRVTEELIKAKQRGVDVRIIADALNASTKHSKHNELRDANLLVKTENYAGKMHSKSMIVDDEYVIIGSMNFSYSGENKNDENLILIRDPEIAKFYKKFFLYQWDKIDNKWLKLNARAEGKDSIGSCSDGIDNNYDGKKDLSDPACR